MCPIDHFWFIYNRKDSQFFFFKNFLIFLVFMNRRKVEKSNPKYNSALKEFSEKHPFAKEWINMGTPDWHLKQMNISHIWLIDNFGIGYNMPVKDYYAGKDLPPN